MRRSPQTIDASASGALALILASLGLLGGTFAVGSLVLVLGVASKLLV